MLAREDANRKWGLGQGGGIHDQYWNQGFRDTVGTVRQVNEVLQVYTTPVVNLASERATEVHFFLFLFAQVLLLRFSPPFPLP